MYLGFRIIHFLMGVFKTTDIHLVNYHMYIFLNIVLFYRDKIVTILITEYNNYVMHIHIIYVHTPKFYLIFNFIK